MADITYTVDGSSPENIPGFEQYSQNDKELINSFEVNNVFDPSKNYIELHIFSLSDELLESDAQYTNYSQLGNAQSTGGGASVLTVDPVYDSRIYGYDLGGVKLLYHFLNDLYTVNNTTTEFFIESISLDRTELRLLPVSLTDSDVVKFTAGIQNKLQVQSYFDGFRLNFSDNDLFIAVNIDTVDLNQGKAVVVKLYEPLPDTYSEKSRLNIVDIISDSVAYIVDSEITMEDVMQPTLRPANFNLDISDESVVPTGYLTYNDLFSYPVTNANSEIYSLFSEKGIDVSVDFTDYNDFVHFSSAEERLNNFKYKLDLITSYSSSLASISSGAAGSRTYFDNLITGIVNNFDHYERFLYYESGSSSWPKSNTTRPYINIPSINPGTFTPNSTVSTWYSSQLTEAIAFDRTNGNSLANAIPSYLKDDDSNVNYITFIYMIGQHFDNLWTFAKAVTDKYDGDNRINHGISKDLVGEALKNFGVKLYTSNKSIEDLFGSLIGQAYQSGSEFITNYVQAYPTGSAVPIQPSGLDNYQKEIQKRIYHNLPLLLKSKGTERGLRALINCFGIPSDILQIKYYGGRNTLERPFFGDYTYYTSSLDKVRLDNTGSIIPGNTLSSNTSNIKRNPKYTDDLHNIEVGFAPSDNVDRYIISQSSATFNIDDYIGDPRNLTTPNYQGLYSIAEGILGNLDRYNLQDYVRLIKFFDNVIFKMVKDFVPARVVADTGIIIKPNLLNRSKAKSVSLTVTRPEHSGSVNTAFIGSGDGGIYYSGSLQASTAYNRQVTTPEGTYWKKDHRQEEAKYDGELGNSELTITDGELGKKNPYLNPIYPTTYYDIGIYYTIPSGLCTISPKPPGFATPGLPVNLATYFTNTNGTTLFSIGTSLTNLAPVTTPDSYTFQGGAGQVFYVRAQDPNSTNPCIKDNTVTLQVCTLSLVNPAPELIVPGDTISFSDYIVDPTGLTNIEYSVNGIVQLGSTYTVPSDAVQQNLNVITLQIKSNQGTCILTKVFNVTSIGVTLTLNDTFVTTAELTMTVTNSSGNATITEKGICWSTSPNPTVNNFKLASNAPIAAPIVQYPFPLSPSTLYYMRGYSSTALGTIYSPQVSTTTRQLGVTTLTLSTVDSYINFIAAATNPATLPLKTIPIQVYSGFLSGGWTTQNVPGINVEFTTTAIPNQTSTKAVSVGNTSPTAANFNNIAVPIYKASRQPNAPYSFIAKATYTQGNSGHDLVIPSTPLSYTVPKIMVGDSFEGGTVFATTQYGNPFNNVSTNYETYTGTTKIMIVSGSDARKNTTPQYLFRGGTNSESTAAAANVSSPYTGWRLPTQTEATYIHNARFYQPGGNWTPVTNWLGAAGTSLSANTNPYTYWSDYWTSTPYTQIGGFKNVTISFHSAGVSGDLSYADAWPGGGSFSEERRVRPIRINTSNVP